LTLIQSIPISVENDKLTHNDLSYSALLLLYSSPMVPDSYIDSDSDNGRKSFELFRKSYNGINSHKNLDTNVIVSYNDIEEKHVIKKTALRKQIRINPPTTSSSKASEDIQTLNNKFLDAAFQVKNRNPITQVSNNDEPDLIDQD
ncbi:3513_t:CDS:2, partial [Racocetra persica]